MVQSVIYTSLPPGQQKIFLEKPRVLRRIFFKIVALIPPNAGYPSKISFGDPMFYSYFVLNGLNIYFESKGEGIFQGDIWLRNQSDVSVGYTATEILI